MANTYLTRTPTTENINKLTLSCWVKRGSISNNSQRIFSNSSSEYLFYRFDSNEKFRFTIVVDGSETTLRTERVFRDTSAWYNIVVRWDTTQSTEADRIQIWVNGVRETSFSLATYPALNSTSDMFNNGTPFEIGRYDDGNSEYFNGSLSYLICCSGYAYDASYFGSTDSTTGEWKINTSPSVTYGTNGFFILKNGNSVTDQSGNGNNFTVGGGTLTNTEDCPSNVFATLNPLLIGSYATLSNGNNTITGTSSSNNSHRPATLQVGTSGKYYYEVKVTSNESGSGSEYSQDGIVPNAEVIQQGDGNGAAGFYPKLYFDCQGKVERSNLGTGLSDLTGLTSVGSTGIKMFAIDMDNGAIYIGANGTWLNNGSAVGVPTSGASKTGAMWSFTPSDYPNIAICSSAYYGSVTNYNFGNGYFGTSAVASAGTNASSNGIFEYDVPTGYTALSTKGLNL